ncbi:hypothetical protein KAH81_04195 [bacterium]|nr:hypothetical protein [bacterium]
MRSLFVILLLISSLVFPAVPFLENAREILPSPFDGHAQMSQIVVNLDEQALPGWRGIINQWTGRPYRAFGKGIEIPHWVETPELAENAVRAFIDDHPDIFCVSSQQIRTVKCKRHLDTWFVIFDQLQDGKRIYGARLDFRISPDGKLFMFGDQTLPAFKREWPVLSAINTIDLAQRDLGFQYSNAEELEEIWLPIEEDGRLVPHPVRRIDLTVDNPPSKWACYVDITTGATLMRVNKFYYFSGYITASVEVSPVAPWNTTHTRPIRWGRIVFGSYYTDASDTGYYNFSTSSSGTAIHELEGAYLTMNDSNGAEPYFSTSVSGSADLDIHMDDSYSGPEERSAYVWAMRALRNTKLIDPSFTGMDVRTGCNVNLYGSCNAYWNGSSINFYREGEDCPNIARIKDVVMHEYTHGITSAIYDGSGYDPLLAVNESWSDYFPCTDSDNPQLGRGFFGSYTYLRLIDNDMVYPDDWEGEGHHDGMILSAALWDMRAVLGRSYSDTLFMFARYGLPYNFSDYYYDILAVDDDDADLSNGTPNYCVIADAFGEHGIGGGADIILSHTPLGDTENTHLPYSVVANLVACASSSWLPESVLVRFSIDGFLWATTAMTSTGGTVYTGSIPPQPAGTIVRYAVVIKDNLGHSKTHPSDYPDRKNIFAVGSQVAIFEDDFDSDLGWSSGATGDDASTGQWVREDPYETYNTSTGLIYQSEDDHTSSPGTHCWVTGNAPMSQGAGYADVDGGKVTLLSPIINLSAYPDPMVKYWRWFTNETSLDDSFWVAASSDGGSSWHVVEVVPQTENNWTRVVFPLTDFITATSNVRFAFQATDYRSGSLTEAMVDDFGIYAYVPVAVEERLKLPEEFDMEIWPNPFNASLRMEFSVIPEKAEIFDIVGRQIVVLVPGKTIIWNGEDVLGEEIPSGIYFVRASFGDSDIIKKVSLIR